MSLSDNIINMCSELQVIVNNNTKISNFIHCTNCVVLAAT